MCTYVSPHFLAIARYEMARFVTTIRLMAGSSPLSDTVLPLSQLAYNITQLPSGVQAALGSGGNRDRLVVTSATADDVVVVESTFSGVSATVSVDVSTTPVWVTGITGLALSGAQSQNTLANYRNTTNVAQATLGVVLSDGRQIPQAVTSGGSNVLPGLFTFASSVSSALAIHPTTGAVELRDNYHDSITVSVNVTNRGTVSGSTLQAYCNLLPRPADVDLGGTVGAPIPRSVVSQWQNVDVTVNTGSYEKFSLSLSLSLSLSSTHPFSTSRRSILSDFPFLPQSHPSSAFRRPLGLTVF